MTFCSVCKAHGQDDDICKTHMFDSWRKCRYHDRYAGDDKLQVTVTSTAAADSVAPDISVTMPRTPSKAPRPSATVDDASSAPSGAGTWTGPEILSKLFSNELSRNAAVQLLMLRIAKASVDEAERAILKETLSVVKDYSVSESESHEEDTNKAAKELLLLQQRNGKRVGMLMATHRRMYADLHFKSRSTSVQQVYKNADTGEAVVTAEAAQDVTEANVLHMVLVDFMHVCTAYMLLTATEGRGLHKWACRSLFLSVANTPLVVYRTIVRLLQYLDAADIGNDLNDIIDAHAAAFLTEEVAIARRPLQGAGQGVHTPHAPGLSIPVSDMVAPGSKSLAVPYPRRDCCFHYTNGYDCKDLDEDGVCKYIKQHTCCGFRYRPDGGDKNKFCNKNHRAINCPFNNKTK